jgi:hypothetical protein
MRCDEVIRELAAPTGDRPEEAMADHLAGCPTCAEWARRAARLDHLWEATRAPEPSPETWDSVWGRIAQALHSGAATEMPSPTTPRPFRNGSSSKVVAHLVPAPLHPPADARPRRRALLAWAGLAQAAAILIAVGFAWHVRDPSRIIPVPPIEKHTPPGVPSAIQAASPVRVEAEIEEGRLVMIRVEGPRSRVDDMTPEEIPTGADLYYVWSPILMFNEAESINFPAVASR